MIRPQHPDPDPELPIDPDSESLEIVAPRPVHLHWRFIGLVALGGAIGTSLREAISLALPAVAGLPVGILVINLSGALVLGALLEGLALAGPDVGRRRALRLFVGTGVLGGYTTYSALANDSARLLGTADALGLVYPVATVVLGALATLGGIIGVRALARRNRPRTPAGADS